MTTVRTVPLAELRPSPLYVDAASLRAVLEWFDAEDPDYDPLPAARFGGETALLDGHTRALAAHLAGADELRVAVRPAVENAAIYRECLQWCAAAGVTAVPDLVGRVVGPERFREEWVRRCHASPHYSE